MFKKIYSSLLISIFTLSISVNASTFGIDQNLSLSPTEDTLVFSETSSLATQTESFIFTNNGSQDRHIQLLSEPVYPFSVDETSFELNANTSHELIITLNSSSVGQFRQSFKIKETTTNEIKTLVIEANITNPNSSTNYSDPNDYYYTEDYIYYSPENTLEFPDTIEDFSSEMYVAVTNHYEDTQTIEVIDEPGGAFYLVSTDKIYLSENETDYFIIRFTPSYDRSYDDSITFEDEDGNETTIDLEGEGINSDEDLEFQVVSDEINPNANQKAYFNFYLDEEADIEILIEDENNNDIYTYSDYNEGIGRKNRKYYWDGDDDDNDQVDDGTYSYTVEIETDSETYTFTGDIEVNTDVDTGEEVFRSVVGFPIYPSFSETRPQDIDPITTNEGLIYRLKVTPEYTRNNNQDIDISFENTKDGKATVKVYDENNTRKLTIESDDSLDRGYHKDIYTWDNTEFNGKDAEDGKYIIKVTFEADDGDIDTDVVYVNLNRDGNLERENFDPPYPNYDNTYLEYYNEFEDEFGYEPNCSIMVDVPENSYTCAAAKFVFDTGVIQGNYINYDLYLRPNDSLTRAEALTIILRVMGMELEEYDAEEDGNLGFKDLNTKGWYAPYVKTMIKTAKLRNTKFGTMVPRILQGYPDGTLRPNNEINRAEFYKIFLEAAQQSENIRANFNLNYDLEYNPFIDADMHSWFAPYADFTKQYLSYTLFAEKYFNSYELIGENSFYPNASITRGEVMELLYETERLNLIQF